MIAHDSLYYILTNVEPSSCVRLSQVSRTWLCMVNTVTKKYWEALLKDPNGRFGDGWTLEDVPHCETWKDLYVFLSYLHWEVCYENEYSLVRKQSCPPFLPYNPLFKYRVSDIILKHESVYVYTDAGFSLNTNHDAVVTCAKHHSYPQTSLDVLTFTPMGFRPGPEEDFLLVHITETSAKFAFSVNEDHHILLMPTFFMQQGLLVQTATSPLSFSFRFPKDSLYIIVPTHHCGILRPNAYSLHRVDNYVEH